MIHPEHPDLSLEEELAMWQTADAIADDLLGEEAAYLMRECVSEAVRGAADIEAAKQREIESYVNVGVRALADYVRGGPQLVAEIEGELWRFTEAQNSNDLYDRTEWHYYNDCLKEGELKPRERVIRSEPNRKLEHKLAKIERGNSPHERA